MPSKKALLIKIAFLMATIAFYTSIELNDYLKHKKSTPNTKYYNIFVLFAKMCYWQKYALRSVLAKF